MKRYLLLLTNGHYEDESNATLMMAHERDDDVAPEVIVKELIYIWRQWIKEEHKSRSECCEKYVGKFKYCPQCGRSLNVDYDELAFNDWHSVFHGTYQDVGMDFDDYLRSVGFAIGFMLDEWIDATIIRVKDVNVLFEDYENIDENAKRAVR